MKKTCLEVGQRHYGHPPILNLTMKDNLNPSSKSLHRTDRPPPLLCHGDYGRVLDGEQARLVIKGIALS